MKTHPPVNVGKTSAEKPVKQFQCGKCGKTFVKGRGYNARTCGKASRITPKKESVPRLENPTPPTGAKRTTSISEVDTLLQQKLKKGERVSRKPQRTVYKNGTVRWTLDGKLHNPDGPAVEFANGDKAWYRHGKLHRLDGPAVEFANGYKAWYRHGKRHNPDGPAIEWANGTREWWVDDVETKHPNLCERAVLHDLTDEEFYELCTHEDYVVRQLAMNNPYCPVEWRVLVNLMDA